MSGNDWGCVFICIGLILLILVLGEQGRNERISKLENEVKALKIQNGTQQKNSR